GLMISGLAWAAQALRINEHAGAQNAEAGARADQAATAAFDFVLKRMSAGDDRLHSVFKEGKSKLNAYLDDYAFLSMAALDLARFSREQDRISSYLEQARKWTGVILKHFKSADGPGYSFTSDDHERLIHR